MGLLKKTDASALAREAIALAEENAATAEKTYRVVTTDVEAGQSIEVGVRGGGEVYAEIFSPRFRFVASAAVASLKLTLSVRGGAFFEP